VSRVFEYRSYRVEWWWWLVCFALGMYLVPPIFPYRFHVSVILIVVTAVVGYRDFFPRWNRKRIYQELCRLYDTDNIEVAWDGHIEPFVLWIETTDDLKVNIDRLLPIVYTTRGERREEYLRYVSHNGHIKILAPSG